MYKEIFLTNVLRVLSEKNISKKELAEKAHISPSFISDITNGPGNPSLKVCESIAFALGVPLSQLIESTDLDSESLKILSEGKIENILPDGFHSVTAILTDYERFEVLQKDKKNRALIAKMTDKDS